MSEPVEYISPLVDTETHHSQLVWYNYGPLTRSGLWLANIGKVIVAPLAALKRVPYRLKCYKRQVAEAVKYEPARYGQHYEVVERKNITRHCRHHNMMCDLFLFEFIYRQAKILDAKYDRRTW